MLTRSDKERIVTINQGGFDQFQVKLVSPVKIVSEFDISKDAKFSIRTLMLLSVLAIGLFSFKITPTLLTIAGFPQIKINGPFTWFITLIILGQGIIAWLNYESNINKIKIEYSNLKRQIQEIKEQLDGYYLKRIRFTKNLIELKNNNVKSFENIKNLKIQITQNEQTIKTFEQELNYVTKIFNSHVGIHKYINGKFVFWLASCAIASNMIYYIRLKNQNISNYKLILIGILILILCANLPAICKLISKIIIKMKLSVSNNIKSSKMYRTLLIKIQKKKRNKNAKQN